jgi:hypothetical protein
MPVRLQPPDVRKRTLVFDILYSASGPAISNATLYTESEALIVGQFYNFLILSTCLASFLNYTLLQEKYKIMWSPCLIQPHSGLSGSSVLKFRFELDSLLYEYTLYLGAGFFWNLSPGEYVLVYIRTKWFCIFYHFYHKRQHFRIKKAIKHKMCVLIFPTTFV